MSIVYDRTKQAVDRAVKEIHSASLDSFDPLPFLELARVLALELPNEWESVTQQFFSSEAHPSVEAIIDATSYDLVRSSDREREGCFILIQRLVVLTRGKELGRNKGAHAPEPE